MQEIANSLRQRLGARPEPQEHPDLNLLAAYGENALSASERSQVVLHLAECTYCREVVALSLPQAAAVEDAHPAFRSRFWIPAFRWGAALATLAIAATLIIEKPWKQDGFRQASSTQKSQAPSTSPEIANQPGPVPAVAPESPASGSRNKTVAGGGAVADEIRPAREAAPAPLAIDTHTIAGLTAKDAAPVQLESSRPVRLAASPAPPPAPKAAAEAAYSYNGAERDYVNTNVLRAGNSFDNGSNTSADAANLPQAPAPRNSNVGSFPPISTTDVGSRAFAANVVPPNTASAPASSGPDVTTFKSSKGIFHITSRVGEKAGEVVRELGRTGSSGQPSGLAGFSISRKPNLKLADNENADKTESASRLRWRVSPEGILMNSSDATRWHEAYPQNSDLQLKVVVTRSDQVWAGGNNGTLIHSWNAGVDWEKMTVPDSGDITSITIDDGWQVKTSDGQTFVSQDHGKTWVPVQNK